MAKAKVRRSGAPASARLRELVTPKAIRECIEESEKACDRGLAFLMRERTGGALFVACAQNALREVRRWDGAHTLKYECWKTRPFRTRAKGNVFAVPFLHNVIDDWVSLDSWTVATRNVYLKMSVEERARVRDAGLADPVVSVGELNDDAASVALRLAIARRYEVMWAMNPMADYIGKKKWPKEVAAADPRQQAFSKAAEIHHDDHPGRARVLPGWVVAGYWHRLILHEPKREYIPSAAEYDRLEAYLRRQLDRVATPIRAQETTKRQPLSLSVGEQAVLDALDHCAADAMTLAKNPKIDANEDGVRQFVAGVRRKRGKNAIGTKSGFGYFRSDAPPDWNAMTRKKRRRNRLA